jgi:hypothetical protein
MVGYISLVAEFSARVPFGSGKSSFATSHPSGLIPAGLPEFKLSYHARSIRSDSDRRSACAATIAAVGNVSMRTFLPSAQLLNSSPDGVWPYRVWKDASKFGD